MHLFQNARASRAKIIVLGVALIVTLQIMWNISVRYSPREFPEIWETAKVEDFQFAIDYPRNWRLHELPQGSHGDMEVILSVGEGIRCFFCVRFGDIGPTVYVAHKSFNMTSNVNVSRWGRERAVGRSLGGFYEIENTEMFQNDEYRIIIRTYRIKDSISKELEPSADIYIIRENDVFIFTLDAEPKDYEEIYPIFERISLSFDSTR